MDIMEKEKINALFKTRIHLINTLTDTKGWIQEAIYAGEVDNINTKKEHALNVGENLSASTNNTWSYS